MSHFVVYANIPCPEYKPTDFAMESEQKDILDETKESFILKLLGQSASSSFERDVISDIDLLMEPFEESTENEAYLEFVDIGDSEREKYETAAADFVKMTNGTICTVYDSMFTKKFVYQDGLVYQRNVGPLHHDKRTAKAKKIKVLASWPVKKKYKSFAEYMEDYCGYSFDDKHQAYGYDHNPNAQWDWYQIGGRWPFMFLVPESEQCVLTGERSWANANEPTKPAPEGYKWVAGAKKSAICWDKMKLIKLKSAVKQFVLLKNWFRSGVKPNETPYFANLTDEGVAGWGEMLYCKGELLGEYLHRRGLGSAQRIACSAYAYLHDGSWQAKGNMGWWAISTNDKEESLWADQVANYLDSIPDDDILVSIDCHI